MQNGFVYDEVLSVGGVSIGGSQVTRLIDTSGTDVPFALAKTATRNLPSTSPPDPTAYDEVTAQMLGFVGRASIAKSQPDLCKTSLRLSIIGPVGSGRRTLAESICYQYGVPFIIIDAIDAGSKYVFETDTKIVGQVKSNSSKGVVSIVVNLGPDNQTTETSRSNVYAAVTRGIRTTPFVIVLSEELHHNFAGRDTITLCPGSKSAVIEWLMVHHPLLSMGDLIIISNALGGQPTYPIHIANATGSTPAALITSIRANILSDPSLQPTATDLLLPNWVSHASRPFIQSHIRAGVYTCLQSILTSTAAVPYIGLLLYGPEGTGKTHTFNMLKIGGPWGTPRVYTSLAGIEVAVQLWNVYREEAPVVLVLLDECDIIFAAKVTRLAIQRICGGEDSLENLFMIGTTNSTPGCFHPALFRQGRFKPLEVSYTSEEEWAALLPNYPYMPEITYQIAIGLVDLVDLYAVSNPPLFLVEYFELFNLQYILNPMTEPARDAYVASISNMCVHDKVVEVVTCSRAVLGGTKCAGYQCVTPDIIQLLPNFYDAVYYGPNLIPKMVAYDIITGLKPWVAVVVTPDQLKEVDCYRNIRTFITVFVCKLVANLDCNLDGCCDITVVADSATPGPPGANGNGITNVVNNGDGTFTFYFTNGTTFNTGSLVGPAGPTGPAGAQGLPGVGIASIVDNGDGTFTITLTDGLTYTTADFDGADGVGIDFIVNNGDGTFTVHLTDGTTHVTSDFTGPPGPAGVGIANIMDLNNGTFLITTTNGTNSLIVLPPGPAGAVGPAGNGIVDVQVLTNMPGVLYQLRFVFTDGTDFITGNLLGPQGPAGVGIASIINNGPGAFTIIMTDGSSFTTLNFTGPAGATGVGISTVTNNGNGTFTLNFTDGSTHITDNFTGPPGQDGVGISTIIDNTNGTMTVVLTNGMTLLINLPSGPQGPMGVAGNGITTVVNNGNGTYTFNFTTGPPFTTGDLTGPPGLPGADGVGIFGIVENVDTSITITLTNGTTFTTSPLQGAAGVGIASTVDNGDGTFTLNYTNGTSFTTIDLTGLPGATGPIGLTGPPGVPGSALIICSAWVDNTIFVDSIGAMSVLNDCVITYDTATKVYTLTFAVPRTTVDYLIHIQSLEWSFGGGGGVSSGGNSYLFLEAVVGAVVENTRTLSGFQYVMAHPNSQGKADTARNVEHNITVFDAGAPTA